MQWFTHTHTHTQLLSLRQAVASRSPGPSSGGLRGNPAGPNSQTCTHASMDACACRCCRNGTLASNTSEQLARKHPQHVTTLTMNKRNENVLRKAPHRTEATPDIENPKSKLINVNHTHTQKQLTPKMSNKHVNLSWDGTCATIGHPNSPQD